MVGLLGPKNIKYALNKYNPDIILIADTGLTSVQPLKFFPYIVYKYNTQGLHSGVAILIKPNIQHKLVKHKFEHDTIAIQVETLSGPVIIWLYSTVSYAIQEIIHLRHFIIARSISRG